MKQQLAQYAQEWGPKMCRPKERLMVLVGRLVIMAPVGTEFYYSVKSGGWPVVLE